MDDLPLSWLFGIVVVCLALYWFASSCGKEEQRNKVEKCIEAGGDPLISNTRYSSDVICVPKGSR